MSARNETFNADAEIVWRLGAELFTDSTQALLELIKNSYDADATRVRVDIERPTEGDRGRIVMTDDGNGMDDRTIIDGWLTLSASPKREQKDRGETTDLYGRVPLGDKGLGRLGAQLLGGSLRLRTRPRPIPARKDSQPAVEHDVRIDFADFAHGRLLTDVEPEWFEYDDELPAAWPGSRPWGTVLEITDLRDYGDWLEPYELAKRLSILINPYRRIERFRLAVFVDGVEVDIESVSRNVRDAALGRWRVVYDGAHLELTGRLRKEWFRPKDKDRFERLQVALRTEDGREEFAERANDLGPLRDYAIRQADAPWLLEIERRVTVPDDIDGLRGADPGPFEMEIDIVALQLTVARDASLAVFDRQREYRDWVRERATVAVYRDGFVVAEENDLLELGKSFTSGGSYYGLRPQNVMGYVAISGRDNPKLQETTSRQAFRQSRELDRFEDLLEFSRVAINRVLDEVGRAGTDFARELSERDRGLFGLTAEELVDEAEELGERGRAAAATVARAERVLTTILQSGVNLGIDEQEGREALAGLAEASRVMEAAGRLAPVAANLRDRLDELQDAREELISSAALGLAAEGLAHDLTAIIERLRGRAAKASRYHDLPTDVQLLLDDVGWAAGALRNQLRHLDPMLRTSRLRRERVALDKVVRSFVRYHRDSLRAADIEMHLHVHEPATVRLSPGRLGQVFDNLVLNSRYWLTEHPPHGPARIDVTVEGSQITVSDNGPGVAADLGDGAFELFVTRRDKGRGMGLWLARQLLDADGATLTLEDDDRGVLNTFVIDYGQ